MNDTMITVVGNVVDSPRKVRLSDTQVTNFRVASTPRRFDSATQRYVDGATFFVDVECWGPLSANVSGSVSQGDPVMVVGAISTHEWETDTGRRSKPRIRARAVGHDLSRGFSHFTKIKRSAPGSPEEAAEPRDAGPLVDPADEQYADGVDPLTGELLPESGKETSEEELPEFLRGRDYVTDSSTLHPSTSDDLASRPAHV